jgi:hypothetical protein
VLHGFAVSCVDRVTSVTALAIGLFVFHVLDTGFGSENEMQLRGCMGIWGKTQPFNASMPVGEGTPLSQFLKLISSFIVSLMMGVRRYSCALALEWFKPDILKLQISFGKIDCIFCF